MAVDPLASRLGIDNENTLSAWLNLAYAYLLLGDSAEASRQLTDVLMTYENGCRAPDELLASAQDLQRQLG
ncbi:hypothetical protein [Nonomuraea wenchangensis]|uniref:hypothetical protein n=1 Tax=Nonomuraea wenchangensis TaxID=568860 RepID=UPI0011601BCD|nr:hypothetical protein [Nonomuraea wenchangensis]